MKLSIIIPAYNEEKLIASALSSIQKALAPAIRLSYDPELIVVDNNSDDRTAELAAQFGARVVFEPIHQISRVRNAGAGAAKGDWLIFIDADCWPEAPLINDVLDCIRDQGVMGGGSVLTMEDVPFLLNLMIGLWNGLSRLFRWAAGLPDRCLPGHGRLQPRIFRGGGDRLPRSSETLGPRAGQTFHYSTPPPANDLRAQISSV